MSFSFCSKACTNFFRQRCHKASTKRRLITKGGSREIGCQRFASVFKRRQSPGLKQGPGCGWILVYAVSCSSEMVNDSSAKEWQRKKMGLLSYATYTKYSLSINFMFWGFISHSHFVQKMKNKTSFPWLVSRLFSMLIYFIVEKTITFDRLNNSAFFFFHARIFDSDHRVLNVLFVSVVASYSCIPLVVYTVIMKTNLNRAKVRSLQLIEFFPVDIGRLFL